MAGLLTTASLQLVMTADDQLSSVLTALQDQVSVLTERFAALGDIMNGISDDMDEVMGTVADTTDKATQSVQDLEAAFNTAADTSEAAGSSMVDSLDAGAQAADRVSTALRAMPAEIDAMKADFADFTAAEDAAVEATRALLDLMQQMRGVGQADAETAQAFADAIASANDLATTLGGTLSDVSGPMQTANTAMVEFKQTLAEASAQATDMAASLSEAEGTSAKTAGTSFLGGFGSGLGGKIMTGGMMGLMGYMGLGMLSNVGQEWQGVLAMMHENTGMTAAQSAQAMNMLGYGGISGAGSASFLQGMYGSLRTTLTPQIGTGMLSKNAILLQSLGINQQSLAQSPWMLLNQIQSQYMHLIGQGQGGEAAQLLSLTGTGQLQGAFTQWGSLQKQTANTLPANTSEAQIKQLANQSMQLSTALFKLSMAFDMLATDLTPMITPLVRGFGDIVTAINKSRVIGPILDILGEHVRLLAGAFAAFKLTQWIAQAFKGVATMQVAAGVVNVVGKGGPGGGLPGVPAAAPSSAPEDVASGGLLADLGLADGGLADVASLAASTVAFPLALLTGIPAMEKAAGVPINKHDLLAPGPGGLNFMQRAMNFGSGASDAAVHLHTLNQHTRNLGGAAALAGRQLVAFNQHTRDVSSTASLTGTQFQSLSQHARTMMASAVQAGDQFHTLHASLTDVQGGASQFGTSLSAGLLAHLRTAQGGVGQFGQTTQATLDSWNTGTQGTFNTWASTTAATTTKSLATIRGQWQGWLTALGTDLAHQQQQSSPKTGVAGWVQQAMKLAGVSGSGWSRGLMELVHAESGGNPHAVAKQGALYGYHYYHGRRVPYYEHAQGLAQMMPSTFGEYAMAGMGNIMNPIDNLIASIRYIMANFGNMGNLIRSTGLGTSGYKGYASGGLLSEPVRGVGLNSGQGYLFGESGPEWVIPQSRMGGGGGGGAVTLNVNVVAGTSDPRGLAQQVSTEILQVLKRQGNWNI